MGLKGDVQQFPFNNTAVRICSLRTAPAKSKRTFQQKFNFSKAVIYQVLKRGNIKMLKGYIVKF